MPRDVRDLERKKRFLEDLLDELDKPGMWVASKEPSLIGKEVAKSLFYYNEALVPDILVIEFGIDTEPKMKRFYASEALQAIIDGNVPR